MQLSVWALQTYAYMFADYCAVNIVYNYGKLISVSCKVETIAICANA